MNLYSSILTYSRNASIAFREVAHARPPLWPFRAICVGAIVPALSYNADAVFRAWPALVVLFLGVARGAAPSYSAAGIVNSADYSTGPFAPNSLLTIFGTGLATATHSLAASDIINNTLPTNMNGTAVYVDYSPAPLFYVAADPHGQINFVLPSRVCAPAPPCTVVVRVVVNSLSGPDITLNVTAAAPALFPTADGFAIATHGDSASEVTPDAPAHAGDIVVLYATGLGRTTRDPDPGELPNYTALLEDLSSLTVTVGGVPLTPPIATDCRAGGPPAICYAGLTPLSAALYQINFVLPPNTGPNPEIRVLLDGQASPAGVRLAVQ